MAPRPSLCGPQEARLLVAHAGGGTRRESRGAASGLPGSAGLWPLAALGSDAPSARADSRNSLRCLLCLLCDPRPGTNTQTLTAVNLGFQGPRPGGSGQRWPGRGCRVPDKTEQSAGGCGEGQPRPAARPAGGCVDRPSGALTPSRTHPGPRLERQPPARRWLAWRGMRLVYLSLLSGHLTQMPPRGPVA